MLKSFMDVNTEHNTKNSLKLTRDQIIVQIKALILVAKNQNSDFISIDANGLDIDVSISNGAAMEYIDLISKNYVN